MRLQCLVQIYSVDLFYSVPSDEEIFLILENTSFLIHLFIPLYSLGDSVQNYSSNVEIANSRRIIFTICIRL